MSRIALGLVVLLIGFGSVVPGVWADEVQAPPAPALEDFSWLAGHWQGEPPGGGQAEEIWTQPAAGAMMGSFRWTRGDKVIVYEFLLLEQTEQGIVLHLRHYGPGSIGWEEKDAPLTFQLLEGSPQGATFQATTPKGWLRLVMQPLEGDRLVVVLEREGQSSLTFEYSRARG